MKKIIFVLLSSIISSLGLGAGTVLILYLTLSLGMSQKQAQGVNLLLFIPCALYCAVKYKKDGLIYTKRLGLIIISGVLGSIPGYVLLGFIRPDVLKRFFGAFLLILAGRDICQIIKQSGAEKFSADRKAK